MKKWMCLLLTAVLLLSMTACRKGSEENEDFSAGSLLFDIGAVSIDSVESFSTRHEVYATEITFSKEDALPLAKYRFQENCPPDLLQEVFLFPKTKMMQIGVDNQTFSVYLLEDGRIVVHLSDGHKVYTADEAHLFTPAMYQALVEKYTTQESQTQNTADRVTGIYRDFLRGKVQATDKQGEPFSVDKYTKNSDGDTWEKYALYDMNGDEVPELIIKNPWFFEILTAKDGAVKLWHENAVYCRPLNDGSLLYERPGSAPEHTSYQYIRLDCDGNAVYRLTFAAYTPEDNTTVYHINGAEVDRTAYDAITGEFFRIGEDKITWSALQDVPEDLSNSAANPKDYETFLDKLRDENTDAVYLLRDIGGSSTQELLVKEGTKLTVYTLDGTVQKVDEYDFHTGTLRLLGSNDPKYPGIFVFTVGGGANHYRYMTLKDGKLSIEKLWDEFYSLPANDPDHIKEFSSDRKMIEESKQVFADGRDLQFTGFGEERLLQVLNSERPFIHEEDGVVYLKDSKLTGSDRSATPSKYTFVDLDGDGPRELIVSVTPDNDVYMVFHIENDGIHSYEFGIRHMNPIKTDGTLVGSGGAGIHTYYRLLFQDGKYEQRELAYCCDYPGQEEYRAYGKSVTKDGFAAFYNGFASTPDVVWTELP